MLNHMVEHAQAASDSLGRVFGALADPTRRQILSRLREGDATIGTLAEPLPMSFAAVSKHVRVLERAGLLRREVRGREHRLSLDAAPLRDVTAWSLDYQEFWNDRLDALERVLRRRKRNANPGRAR